MNDGNMDENESLVIEVTGINPNTSEDTLENYFGSPRRGGDVASIEYIRGSGNALITFANVEGKENWRKLLRLVITELQFPLRRDDSRP